MSGANRKKTNDLLLKSRLGRRSGLLSSPGRRSLGPIQINSGWNVPTKPPEPHRGALPPDQIRTGAA